MKSYPKIPRTRPTLPDVVIIFALIIITAATFFIRAGNRGEYFVIEYDGTRDTYPINIDQTYRICSSGVNLTVTVRDGAVFVEESDCPDKICVYSGKISRAGQAIICTPAKVVISIPYAEPDKTEADAVAGLPVYGYARGIPLGIR